MGCSGENRCCGNNKEKKKEETAKEGCGCICLCLEFSTREAVNALADRFKEVTSPVTHPVAATQSDLKGKIEAIQKATAKIQSGTRAIQVAQKNSLRKATSQKEYSEHAP